MKIYYAHCMFLYGTKQEERDVHTLSAFGEVVNPNSPESDTGAKIHGMDYFRRFVEECDAIAFRALPDGSIPSGVGKEINWFREAGKPIIELPGFSRRLLMTVEHTREYLREVGQR